MATFFVKTDEKFTNKWLNCSAMMNMAGEILSRKFDANYEKIAEKFYIDRRQIANELEKIYISDIVAIRGQFNWNFVTSRNILVISVPESLAKSQISHMTENKLSFVSIAGEKSDDIFGNNEKIKSLIDEYIKTEPNKIGFQE